MGFASPISETQWTCSFGCRFLKLSGRTGFTFIFGASPFRWRIEFDVRSNMGILLAFVAQLIYKVWHLQWCRSFRAASRLSTQRPRAQVVGERAGLGCRKLSTL